MTVGEPRVSVVIPAYNEGEQITEVLDRLFESVKGDRFRSQQCLERLADKTFAGNEYQRKATTEKNTIGPSSSACRLTTTR